MHVLDLGGGDEQTSNIDTIATRLRQFLEQGRIARQTVLPKIVAAGAWDPKPDAPGAQSYRPWRFFLPLAWRWSTSVGAVFPLPPIRLLNRRVTISMIRCRHDGVNCSTPMACPQATWLCKTVIDATPIAAEDDEARSRQMSRGRLVIRLGG